MADFEVSYTSQKVPEQAKKKYFVVLVDCGRFSYIKDKIFIDYNEATKSKESRGLGVLDSYVVGCSSLEEAQKMFTKYKKWS